MSQSILKTEFNEAAMIKKLQKVSKAYNESQTQSVKRWGVSSCRVLALRTQAFGKSAKVQKLAMMKDARNVLYTHKGTATPSKTGKSMVYQSDKGGKSGVKIDRYLKSEIEIKKWIDSHRTTPNRRTKKLPPEERSVCSDAMFKRAINQKHKDSSGMAKDGWLDAGDQISKRQKGKRPMKIGEGFIKWSRKTAKLGTAKESKKRFRSVAKLINHLGYTSKSYVLKTGDMNKAVKDGLINTLKWYKKSIQSENKKKK